MSAFVFESVLDEGRTVVSSLGLLFQNIIAQWFK
jgi:hypothetical protein